MFYATSLESELKATLVICPPPPLCLRHSFTQQDPFPIKQGELRYPFAPYCGSNTALFGVHSSRANPFLFRQLNDLLRPQHSKHLPHAVTLFLFCEEDSQAESLKAGVKQAVNQAGSERV